MDLRKKILTKAPLSEVSMNSSYGSMYESANEDSIYYSFSNTSGIKELDDSQLESEISKNQSNLSKHHLQTSPESDGGKDDTVIMIGNDTTLEHIEEDNKGSECESDKENKDAPKNDEVIHAKTEVLPVSEETKNHINDDVIKNNVESLVEAIPSDPEPVCNEISIKVEATLNPDNKNIDTCEEKQDNIENEAAPEGMDIDTSNEGENQSVQIPLQIIIEDPNRNVINPFTAGSESPASTSDLFSSTPILLKSAKKSASKIPTRSHFYSPLQRASLDRKAKINIKPPPPARRTIYEIKPSATTTTTKPQVTKLKPSPSTASTSAKSQVTKSNAVKSKPITTAHKETLSKSAVAPKPRPILTFKCTYPGCSREFKSSLAYQQHIKSHNAVAVNSTSGTSSSLASSFKCKWCDKVFSLSNALIKHQIEVCTKIPFGEKRKLIASEEKNKPINNKRKSMFIAPEPVIRKRSPSRRQTMVSRKSGVVTPKKSMKCHVHGCGMVSLKYLIYFKIYL